MALNRNDLSKLSNDSNIEWQKDRRFELYPGEGSTVDEISYPTREDVSQAVIDRMDQVSSKGDKLLGRIDNQSKDLRIPIDPDRQPELSSTVMDLDSESGGNYISYPLYSRLTDSYYEGLSDMTLDGVLGNTNGDVKSDSSYIQSIVSSGYKKFISDLGPEVGYAADSLVNGKGLDLQDVINYAEHYLSQEAGPEFLAWGYRDDIRGEQFTLKSFSGIWEESKNIYPDNKFLSATNTHIDNVNGFFNGIDLIFGDQDPIDTICCFVNFTAALDTKTLKGLAAMIKLAINAVNFEFDISLDGLKGILENFIQNMIESMLLGLVQQILQGLSRPLAGWLDTPNDEWDKVKQCSLANEYLEGALGGAIDYVENLWGDMIGELVKGIGMKKNKFDGKNNKTAKRKKLEKFSKLIDLVLKATERSSLCANGSPESSEVQRIMDDYQKTTMGGPYEYPEEENPTIYNSFISKDIQGEDPYSFELKEAYQAGESNDDNGKLSDGDQGEIGLKKRLSIGNCIEKIKPEDVPKVTQWMEEIDAQS